MFQFIWNTHSRIEAVSCDCQLRISVKHYPEKATVLGNGTSGPK